MSGVLLVWTGLLLAALVGRTPPPSVELILLPQADGSASAVVLQAGPNSQTLSQPYQRVTATTGQALVIDQLEPAVVQTTYPALFSALPPPAERFTVYFEAGGTQLTPESQAMLGSILQAAGQRPGADILVIGHTDAQGSTEDNDALSLKRAQQVRQMLLNQAQNPVAAERIESWGRGKRQLAVPTADGVAEAKNRRVEIVLR